MVGSNGMLDAVIIGVTTGKILTTETYLKNKIDKPDGFLYYGAGTVEAAVA
jgi:hypothetical protein